VIPTPTLKLNLFPETTNSHSLKLGNVPSVQGFLQSAQGRVTAVDAGYALGNPNINHD